MILSANGPVDTKGGWGFEVGAFLRGTRKIFAKWYGYGHRESTQLFTMNEWHHVAIVRQTSSVYMFLDGSLQGDVGSGPGTLNANKKSCEIGADVRLQCAIGAEVRIPCAL